MTIYKYPIHFSPDSLASPLQTVPGFASSPQQQLNQGAAVNGAETYRPNSLALAQVKKSTLM